MTDIKETIEGLEYQAKSIEEKRKFAEKVLRLMRNPDFRDVILKDYIENAAARFAHQIGDPALSPQGRADAIQMAAACGHLKRHLSYIETEYNLSARTLASIENELEGARQELADTEGDV